ncbi:MAG: GNAT family N-acetyltransferase [Vicinamibacterales bacterium]
MVTLHTASTAELTPSVVHGIRTLLDEAFDGAFTSDDWTHACGGVHVWLDGPSGVVSHGALVERTLVCAGHTLRAGYVEAVATARVHRGQGHGTVVMQHIGDLIRGRHPIGALSTGAHAFYEALGWERWRGPTSVDSPAGRQRTPNDDGGVMILRTPWTPALEVSAEIVCDWRSGDVW